MKSFFALLDRLHAAPIESRQEIGRLIQQTFETEKAVLALDMSGFSLAVRRDGILTYLCLIRQMQRLALPVLRKCDGELVKCEADNLLAVFDEARPAVEAAIGINRAIAKFLETADGDPPLAVCIGIDCGRVLLIPAADCFGDAVNIAHKLGEDVARSGEIIVSQRVVERLGVAPPCDLESMTLSLGGLELQAAKVLYADG